MPDEEIDDQSEVDDEKDAPAEGEPKWAEWRYRKAERKTREAKQALESERAARSALEARLAALEGRVADGEKPKAPEGPTLDSLRKWKADYSALVHKVATNPEDTEARAKLAEVKPEHVAAVESAMIEMVAKGEAGRVRQDVDATLAQGRAAVAQQRRLADEFGNDVLDLKSDLMKKAAEEFKELIAEYGDDGNGNAALTRLAVERAYHAVNRGGRGSDKDRRRLAVEGEARREASSRNTIAALVQKGDPKSQRKAVEIGLGEALKKWGLS